MNKSIEALLRLEHNSKRYKGRRKDLNIIIDELKAVQIIKKIGIKGLSSINKQESSVITTKEFNLLVEVINND